MCACTYSTCLHMVVYMYLLVHTCTFTLLCSFDHQHEKGMNTEQTIVIKKEKDFSYTYTHVKGETDDHTVIISNVHHTYSMFAYFRCYILTRRIHWRYTCMPQSGLSTKQVSPCTTELVNNILIVVLMMLLGLQVSHTKDVVEHPPGQKIQMFSFGNKTDGKKVRGLRMYMNFLSSLLVPEKAYMNVYNLIKLLIVVLLLF